MDNIYFKATKANGVSGHDPSLVYKLGLNVHPCPDKISNAACGVGIHLAKTVELAKRFVKGWKEIYEAKAGVIIGEDSEKVRVTHCFLTRLIDVADIQFPNHPCLCGDEWLTLHAFDVTTDQILQQGIEIKSPNCKNMRFTMNTKGKDRNPPVPAGNGGTFKIFVMLANIDKVPGFRQIFGQASDSHS